MSGTFWIYRQSLTHSVTQSLIRKIDNKRRWILDRRRKRKKQQQMEEEEKKEEEGPRKAVRWDRNRTSS